MKIEFFATLPPVSVTKQDWLSWQWQQRHRLTNADDFSRFFKLTDSEKSALEGGRGLFKVQSTPYYAALARDVENDPIRAMILPTSQELVDGAQQMADPLGERRHSPTPRIVHRYPDRVLLLITDTCGVYCRYCLRKHFTGKDEAFISREDYDSALNYIRQNEGIREVILSGGDPLTLSDARLVKVLEDLKAIPHVELVRLGTRMPVICPMRITTELVQAMKRFHPIFIMTHFNHPRELTEEAAAALTLLVDNGFPVFNQMVILRGINNHAAIIQALSRRLLRLRVKPYYAHQCDPSEGSDHFRTSIDESKTIQGELWGRLSGLAMPQFSVDLPGGGGKIGLVPDYEVGHDELRWQFRGWDGIESNYVSPSSDVQTPVDISEYEAEWLTITNQRYGER